MHFWSGYTNAALLNLETDGSRLNRHYLSTVTITGDTSVILKDGAHRGLRRTVIADACGRHEAAAGRAT